MRGAPAIIVSVIALIAAVAGTAVAAPDATTSAVSKKKVKKIAVKQIEKLESGLSVANSAALGGKGASAYAASQSEAVHVIGAPGQPPFTGGADPFPPNTGFRAAGFYKDPVGVVHLQGGFSAGPNAGPPVFQLPAGYRPSARIVLPATCGEDAQLLVEANGNVSTNCPSDDTLYNVFMDGASFRVP